MLDIKLLRTDSEAVINSLKKRGEEDAEKINEILALDTKRRELLQESEKMKMEQNAVSKEIPKLKKLSNAPIV